MDPGVACALAWSFPFQPSCTPVRITCTQGTPTCRGSPLEGSRPWLHTEFRAPLDITDSFRVAPCSVVMTGRTMLTSVMSCMQADVFDVASWQSLLQGAVGVISCLGAFGSNDFMQKICGDSNITVFNEAAKAGVSRAAFISVHDYGLPGTCSYPCDGRKLYLMDMGILTHSVISCSPRGLRCAAADWHISLHMHIGKVWNIRPACSSQPSAVAGNLASNPAQPSPFDDHVPFESLQSCLVVQSLCITCRWVLARILSGQKESRGGPGCKISWIRCCLEARLHLWHTASGRSRYSVGGHRYVKSPSLLSCIRP